MDKIRYYIDKDNGFLLAHESSREFFVIYDTKAKKWNDCNISFSCFLHSYDAEEITEGKALQISNGISPLEKYSEYVEMIKRNLSL